MNKAKLIFDFTLAAFLLGVIYMLLAPGVASTGKPTPEQRANWRCLDYVRFVRQAATNNLFTLDVSKLIDEKAPNTYQSDAFEHLLLSAGGLAKQGEGYLIKTNCITAKTNREIIIVCEIPFDNEKANASFWNSSKHNYEHAVGYSDGSAGVISPTEFTNLDLRGFTSLSQTATNALAVYSGK